MSKSSDQKNIRLIAFYLPQYHPIPENDVWWGEGFTDWINTAKAKPLFKGHYQPHIPGDLGSYDLRSEETREAQANLAKKYGIYGFCYYHYWFHGKRLLHRPIDDMLHSGKPDFPFCLCWANENWTKLWDGGNGEILMKQEYSENDDIHHIRWLANVFRDKRYIRINGKPLFLVYRAKQMPNPFRTTRIWREELRKMGLGEILLYRVEGHPAERGDPSEVGFDGAVEFQPDCKYLPAARARLSIKILRLLGNFIKRITKSQRRFIYDYSQIVEEMLKKPKPSYKRLPCVTPSWDNSPRRKNNAIILKNSSPDAYGHWLSSVIHEVSLEPGDNKTIFINAWNEWAEGCHLEPDQKWGYAYLEATRNALFDSK